MGLLTKPARQPATGPAGRRRAKSGSARALDKGRHACGSSVKQGPVTKAGPVTGASATQQHSHGTSDRRNPCHEYARSAGGRSTLGGNASACGRGGNLAVVMGDVRRSLGHRHGHGGEEAEVGGGHCTGLGSAGEKQS